MHDSDDGEREVGVWVESGGNKLQSCFLGGVLIGNSGQKMVPQNPLFSFVYFGLIVGEDIDVVVLKGTQTGLLFHCNSIEIAIIIIVKINDDHHFVGFGLLSGGGVVVEKFGSFDIFLYLGSQGSYCPLYLWLLL